MVDSTWKKNNYNTKIRVSDQTIQKLRAGKTFENNINIAKKSGVNAQTREALNRFYGVNRVSKALGASNAHVPSAPAVRTSSSLTPKKTTTTKPVVKNTPSPVNNPTTKSYSNVKPKPHVNSSVASSTGNFIKNELLGIDDFSKLRGEMKNHQWKNMAKSILAGGSELGSTAAMIGGLIAAPFTGGATGAASVAAFAAKTGAKTAAKIAAKDATRAAEKSIVKKVARGAADVVAHGVGVSAVRKGKVTAGKFGERYIAGAAKKAAARPVAIAERRAATSTKAAQDAITAQKKATADLKTLKASATGKRPVKGTAAAVRTQANAKAAASEASRISRSANARFNRLSAEEAKRVAALNTKKAAAKKLRKTAIKLQAGHVVVNRTTRQSKGK